MPHVFRYTTTEAAAKIVEHLVAQKKRSYGYDGESMRRMCLYRSPDGCKCALGILIPDDQYKPEHEGRRAFSMVNLVPAISDVDAILLDYAQQYHDDSFRVRGKRFSYGDWIDTSNEAHHPQLAIDHILVMIKELRK